jgi:hypothetical protein
MQHNLTHNAAIAAKNMIHADTPATGECQELLFGQETWWGPPISSTLNSALLIDFWGASDAVGESPQSLQQSVNRRLVSLRHNET